MKEEWDVFAEFRAMLKKKRLEEMGISAKVCAVRITESDQIRSKRKRL